MLVGAAQLVCLLWGLMCKEMAAARYTIPPSPPPIAYSFYYTSSRRFPQYYAFLNVGKKNMKQ